MITEYVMVPKVVTDEMRLAAAVAMNDSPVTGRNMIAAGLEAAIAAAPKWEPSAEDVERGRKAVQEAHVNGSRYDFTDHYAEAIARAVLETVGRE